MLRQIFGEAEKCGYLHNIKMIQAYMGVLFSILLWGLIAVIATIFPTLIVSLFSLIGNNEGRRRRLLRAVIGTPVAILSFLVSLFVLNIGLTTLTKTDNGIGDYYYVPLENGYRLSFIDALELSGYIERKDKTILDNVTEIQMNDEMVYAHTSSSYYVLDTSTHQLTELSLPSDEIDLVSVKDFYHMRYRKMNRIGWIVIALISLAVSTSLTRTVSKFIR